MIGRHRDLEHEERKERGAVGRGGGGKGKTVRIMPDPWTQTFAVLMSVVR